MPRIVVIDDSPTVCAIVRLLLRDRWTVETYLRPFPALQDLWRQAETPPAAVILDVELPQLDGFAIACLLRQEAPAPLCSVPIIGISVRDGVLDRVKGRVAGMNAYLTKPFDPADLLHLLSTLSVGPLLLASLG
jgi:twitching motility two-component system response regulator PilG